jgi:glycosyltransferase involved in cell wall biosynthesis
MSDRPGRPRVGFLRHNFLPSSETFIHGSLRALAPHADVGVFALHRRFADKFPVDDIVALDQVRWGWLDRVLYRTTTWSPRFFRWARGVDVIHAHFGYTAAHALWAARTFRRPLVVSWYGHDVTLRSSIKRFDPAYWHYGLFRRRLWRRGDRFCVLSREMEARLVEQGCPADKIRIVRLGVDLSRFDVPRPARRGGPCTILMVGREADKKGFDDGLRACARARDGGADLRVVILGTGAPGQPALRALGEQLGLDVAWPDPSTPVPGAMADADVLLVPSRTAADGEREGTPTVICEGGAARLPIVATRHAGIPEQIDDGATGLLAGERDVDGLAAHLVALAGDPDRRRVLGDAGRAKMLAEYSIDAHARTLVSIYRELLERS